MPIASWKHGRDRSGSGPGGAVLLRSVVVGMGMLVIVAVFTLYPASLEAQFTSNGEVAGSRPPQVFLDCQGFGIPCNRNHFRTEIQWVYWVNDRADADVHIILTSEGVGGGGRRFVLDFIGRGEMAHLADELTYTSQGTDVMDETLNGITHALSVGLMRYAVQAGLGNDFALTFTRVLQGSDLGGDVGGSTATATAFYDPWDYWTFRTGLSGNLDLRESRTDSRINPSFGVDRVTDAWKLNFSGQVDFRRSSRTLSDGREVRDDRDDWRFSALVVRSVTGHVSTGIDFDVRNSLSNNQNSRLRIAPALEYNYYPYAEANRRQLIAHYAVGVEHSNYMEETIFGLEAETVPQHRLGIQYNAREPWGNAGVGIDVSQYLHDTSMYSMGMSGNLNFRITRGLDLNLSGNLSRVNDELHVPLATISDEDILLGRQNLPSSYRYQGSVGFGYRWGSTFTNIVNTRFPNSVR